MYSMQDEDQAPEQQVMKTRGGGEEGAGMMAAKRRKSCADSPHRAPADKTAILVRTHAHLILVLVL